MSKSRRRPLAFESLEGKVMLSTGMGAGLGLGLARPAAVGHAHIQARRGGHHGRFAARPVRRVVLNGALKGIPFGAVQQNGILVSSFNLDGHNRTMGHVGGSLHLVDPLIAPGRMPNLSNATLTLYNGSGSVQIKMAASPSNRHVFIVTGGTGAYSSALGSGMAMMTYNNRKHAFVLNLRSAAHLR